MLEGPFEEPLRYCRQTSVKKHAVGFFEWKDLQANSYQCIKRARVSCAMVGDPSMLTFLLYTSLIILCR